ncbi:MAG: hypothetical protein KBG72_00295 [Agrobacterium sp.]|nr:hypothetical protein [Agrobacterium sp.]
MNKSPKEITAVAGNILSIARSKEEQAKAVAESATSYMPTDIDVKNLMTPSETADEDTKVEEASINAEPEGAAPRKGQRKQDQAGKEKAKQKASASAANRKRVSLYFDDDILMKIFKVSMEEHEQMSSATHRLIKEALKARGL